MNEYIQRPFNDVLEQYTKAQPDCIQEVLNVHTALERILRESPCIIAGGFPMKLLMGLPLLDSDIDLFCFNQYLIRDIVHTLGEAGVKSVKTTDCAYTYRFPRFHTPLQIIRSHWGETGSQITDRFDLEPCKVYTDFKTVWLSVQAAKCHKDMKLRDGNSRNPYVSPDRVEKYIKLGFTPKGTLVQKMHEYMLMRLDEDVQPVRHKLEGPRIEPMEGAGEEPDRPRPRPANVRPNDPFDIVGAVAERAQAQFNHPGDAGDGRAPPELRPRPAPMPARRHINWQAAFNRDDEVKPTSSYSDPGFIGVYLPKYDAWLQSQPTAPTRTYPTTRYDAKIAVREFHNEMARAVRAERAIHERQRGRDIFPDPMPVAPPPQQRR